jgi:hypothetical protein
VPLVALAVTDPILSPLYGFQPYSKYLLFSYLSVLISVWLGRRLRNTENVSRIAALTVMNSIQFFLITNFGSWLWFQAYPRTAAGLASCYISAIPFFGWTLASDILYTGVLFGLYAWLSRTVATGERLPVAA